MQQEDDTPEAEVVEQGIDPLTDEEVGRQSPAHLLVNPAAVVLDPLSEHASAPRAHGVGRVRAPVPCVPAREARLGTPDPKRASTAGVGARPCLRGWRVDMKYPCTHGANATMPEPLSHLRPSNAVVSGLRGLSNHDRPLMKMHRVDSSGRADVIYERLHGTHHPVLVARKPLGIEHRWLPRLRRGPVFPSGVIARAPIFNDVEAAGSQQREEGLKRRQRVAAKVRCVVEDYVRCVGETTDELPHCFPIPLVALDVLDLRHIEKSMSRSSASMPRIRASG